jgi:hypothetical protein
LGKKKYPKLLDRACEDAYDMISVPNMNKSAEETIPDRYAGFASAAGRVLWLSQDEADS